MQNLKVVAHTFTVYFLADSAYPRVFDRPVTTVDYIKSAINLGVNNEWSASRTVEQRIVGHHDTSSQQYKAESASQRASRAASAGESAAGPLLRVLKSLLKALPRILRVGHRRS